MQWQTTTAVEKTTSPKIWDAVLKNLTTGQGPIAREIPVPFWPSEKVFVAHKFIIGATKGVAVFPLSTTSRRWTNNIGVVAASYTTKRLVSAVGPKISYKTWLANVVEKVIIYYKSIQKLLCFLLYNFGLIMKSWRGNCNTLSGNHVLTTVMSAINLLFWIFLNH